MDERIADIPFATKEEREGEQRETEFIEILKLVEPWSDGGIVEVRVPGSSPNPIEPKPDISNPTRGSK